MTSKMVPISIRISQADVEFISQLKVTGAATPSDKVRAIIAEAKRRSEGMEDYRSAFQMMQELFQPVREHIRAAELDMSQHSELVTRLIEWLPDMSAYLLSTFARSEQDIGEQDLLDLEKGVTDRIFRLIESVMQMGVTRKCPCYDPTAVSQHIRPVLELANAISQQSN
ncbi:MAG: hypothetical protein L0Z73_14490 [Gammaproteobacteria bacterium]|nr:hypothetical protein [Gammaproteobacteria bacterium]